MKTKVEKHFDKVAHNYDYYKKKNAFYYQNLKKLLHSMIPYNKKVLEIGCGTGDLLASLSPKYGYGQDLSSQMIKIAKSKYVDNTKIKFSTSWPNEKFDYIFMSDVIEHLEEPEIVFNTISSLMNKNTIFINTMANPIWEPLLMVGEKLNLKMPEGLHNRLENDELKEMLNKSGLKTMKHDYRLLVPVYIPFFSTFVNKHLEKIFKKYAFIEYIKVVKS